MKIISKFQDYYDSAAGYGVDSTQVLLRKKEELTKQCDLFKKINLKEKKMVYIMKNLRRLNVSEVQFSILFFCGKAHPLIKLVYQEDVKEKKLKNKVFHFFKIDDLNDHMKEIHGEEFVQNNWLKKTKKDLYGSLFSEELARNFFNQNISNSEILDLHHHYKSPYFTAEFVSGYGIKRNVTVRLMPELKELGFQKVVDPFSCFQEISQFAFGVLGVNENEIVDIEDKYLVAGKGFDTKYGFRKRPKYE